DARNFTPGALGAPGPFSFDRVELAGSRAGAGVKTPPPPFLPGPLPAAPAATVALDDLVSFLEHPVKQFLRQRVGLPISDGDDDEELVAASARYREGEPGSRDVDVALPDGTRVVGTVSGIHGEVAVRVEFSKLGAKQRVRAWARLVALTAAQPDRRWRAVTVG